VAFFPQLLHVPVNFFFVDVCASWRWLRAFDVARLVLRISSSSADVFAIRYVSGIPL
jgi:hypothetical protein